MTANHPLTWLERVDDDVPAVADDEARLTYGELRDRSRRMAGLVAERVGSGRYLLIPADRSVDFFCSLVASWYSGNVPVPVDPGAPAALIAELGQRCGSWASISEVNAADWTTGKPVDLRNDRLPALVLFTSGTSGIPKGVPVTLENLGHSARVISDYLGYSRHRSAAVVLPLHYSYALLSQVLCMFSVGGYSRIFPNLRNPLKFADAVERDGLETFCGVPTTFQTLITLSRLAPLKMSGVQVVCSAGAAFDRASLPAVKEIFPNALFFDNYGMTEATPRVAYIREDDPRFGEATCGQPVDGMEIRIFAESGLAQLPDREIGIVGVRGPSVFPGYLNDPEATAAAFTEDGFLLSGDVGYLDDGYLFVCGRRDEVFNVGGEKVSPVEIERFLLQHSAVAACAVCAFEDERRGTVPVAYLILREPASRKDLNTFLRAHLPASKVPWRYFEARQLPMTSNGKLQRRRLMPNHSEYVSRELS